MRRSHLAALLPLLTVALAACPPKTNDTADTDAHTGDTGDTGETDTQPASSVIDSDAHGECGELASVIWLEDPSGASETVLMFASTVPDFCGLYQQSVAQIDAEYEAAYDSYQRALVDEDYQAACQALAGWEQSYQALNDAMLPQGSCTAELILASSTPGSYETEGMQGALVALWQVQADVGAAIVAAYDGCEGVMDEASWDERQEAVDDAQWLAMPYWAVTSGEVELAAGEGDLLQASGGALPIQSYTTADTGTLSFDLSAERCEF